MAEDEYDIYHSLIPQKRGVKDLVEDLLDDLYAHQRDWSGQSGIEYSHGYVSYLLLLRTNIFLQK